MKIQLRGKEIKNDTSVFEEKQYSDIWTNDEFLQFLFERLMLLRELLSDTGSIFVHCDRHKSHIIRCLLDEVFGNSVEENNPGLVNEIIWFYPDSPGRPNNRFAPKHDTIYWYSKSGKYTFNDNEIREPILEASKKRYESARYLINSQGKRFEYTGGDSADTGKIPETVWRIPVVKGNSNEASNYPTQKPEQLLERIIKVASKQGDIVFDAFMGSGTVQAVSMRLGRKFIGSDINLGAIQATSKRLITVSREIKNNSEKLSVQLSLAAEDEPTYGKKQKIENYYTGFSVFNVNQYDIFRNQAQAKDLLIEALEIQPYPGGAIWDGEKDGRKVKIMPINRIATKADLNEIIANIPWKEYEKKHNDAPTKPVDYITLVCMGHEPDLAGALQMSLNNIKIDIEVVDILRDKTNLEFKRDSEAKIEVKKDKVVIKNFYPMNLLQKLSLMKKDVEEWRELVGSVMIDFNYDGAVFTPTIVDVPEDDEMVLGEYEIPEDAGNIKIKITDLLSETFEKVIEYGNQ